MSIDPCPDRPDGGFLRDLAEEIQRRAEHDRRRLERLEHEGVHWGNDEASALEAELLLLERAARATERLIDRREMNR